MTTQKEYDQAFHIYEFGVDYFDFLSCKEEKNAKNRTIQSRT